MIRLHYRKMSGSGNTFIMFDGRRLPAGIDLAKLAPIACDEARGHGGADGLIAIYPWVLGDFEMKYYNRDGSTGMMCGNGGRCAVRFAVDEGLAARPETIRFTNAGVLYDASVTPRGVRVQFPSPRRIVPEMEIDLLGRRRQCHFADVGTPHAIMFLDELNDSSIEAISDLDMDIWGSSLRHHESFATSGANANFVEPLTDGSGISLRTYERGVERETGACGTGALSSAIVASLMRGIPAPVRVVTTSGATLWVDFRMKNGVFSNLSLEGDAEVVRDGEMSVDV